MTPEESSAQERVRDLLASAAGPEQMPDEVRVRLDDVLTDLVASREAGEPDEPVEPVDTGDAPSAVSLAARRRRRWPAVLGAAAAVSVLAYGAGVVGLDMVTGSGSDSMSSDSAGGDAGGAEAGGGLALEREAGPKKRDRDGRSAHEDGSAPGEAESAPSAAPTSRPQNSGGKPTDDRGPDGPAAEAYRNRPAAPQLRVATLGADVTAVSAVELRSATKSEADGALGLLDMDPRCGPPREAAGDARYAVRLEGDRATLVLRRAHDGLRVAQVYSCDDQPTMLASTVLPAR